MSIPPTDAGLEDARFAEYDVVALTEAWPEQGLDAGVWGTVLALHVDQTCEVEFTDREGTPIKKLIVPQDRLELVWADPETPAAG
jgi:hypothetical protein